MLCRASGVDGQSFAKSVMSWLRDPDESRRQGRLARDAVADFNGRSRKALAAALLP